MDVHNGGAESLSRPKIIVGQASTPSESSATRCWRGIELGLYSVWGAPRLVAEYPYHSVTLQLKGTRRLVQRRYGQTLDQVTRARCLIVTVVRNNSRRGHVSVRCLQTRADSGMMNTCCSWRERSSE
jgi:hypothetical protein